MAYGVSVGNDLTYGWEDQSAILVTVSTELNIVVCASETSPARYIDILYDQIESVSLEKRQWMSQSSPLVPQNLDILVVWLARSSDNTFYLGAGKRFAPLINIAFTSIDEATAIIKRLLERASHIVEKFTCSESEPLSLFQPMEEKTEEQGMLCDAAADTLRPAIVTSATESVSLPAFVDKHEPDLTHSFLNWPKNISTGLPRTTDLSDLRSDTGISIEDIQIEGLVSCSRSPTKNPDDISEGSLRSSAEWRKGAMLIDTAPELQDTYNHVMEEEELFRKSISPAQATFIERDGDYNSFYNATPRGQDANAKQAEQPMTRNERHPGPKQPLEHILVHNAKTREANENFKSETSRPIAGVAGELHKEAARKNEHVNEDTSDIRKAAVVIKKYTSKKKPVATNTSKKNAFGKIRADRKVESLNVKISRFQTDKKGEDEFDFPLSPRKTRTPRNVQRPIPKMVQNKEGTIGLTPEKKPLAYRSIRPDKGNPLVKDVAAQISNARALSNKVPFKSTKIKGSNDESANIIREEGLVKSGKPNGAELNPRRKKPTRGKAKPASKRVRNKDNEAYSSKKGLGETMRKYIQKPKRVPHPAPQPRSRRAAALIADQRIKKSVNCDASQEQSRSGLTHGFEVSRPNSSQGAFLPNILASNSPNIDRDESQQTKPQLLSKLFGNSMLDHDEKPEITTVSKVSPQDGDPEVVTNSNVTDLRGNQKLHSAVVPEYSTQQCVPANDMNGTPNLDDGNGRAKVTQLTRLVAFTSSPRSGAYVRTEKDNIEEEDDGNIHYRNPIDNDARKSLSTAHLESSYSESPTPRPRMPDGAGETFSSEGLVSAHEISDSRRKSHTRVTPTSSMIEFGSRKSSRFVEMGSKRRALGPEKTYHKADNSLGPRADTAAMTTAAHKQGNTFALNLKKALLSVQMPDEHNSVPEARMQGNSVVQDEICLETPVARPYTKLSKSQISVVEGFQTGNQNQILEAAEVDPGVSTADAFQEPSKRSERFCITVSPLGSIPILHEMEKLNALQANNAFSSEYSENEIQVDKSPSEQRVPDIHVRQTPKRPKRTALQPVQLPHQIRRANPQERLSAQALNPTTTPRKTSPDVNRKSNLISFTSRGPRNQGVIFNQKDQPASPSHSKLSRSLVADVDRSLKRKLPIWGEDLSDPETDLVHGKRPRISTRIPKAQDVVQHRSSVITDATHRPSSQSTRVNENGSPMPFVHSRHFIFRDQGGHASTEITKLPRSILDDDQGDFVNFGDNVDVEPGISALGARLPKAKKISWRNSSSNSKRQRTLNDSQSPRTNQLTAHRIHPSGEFINVHTETVVLPIRPPDPFIETKKPHQNTFMEMLRRSSNLSAKSLESNRLGLPGQDLDKTLIENQKNSPSMERSSSESSSCKRWSSSESSSSDEGGLHEEESWRENLEPHQRGQLDALYDISHVSRNFPGPKPEADATLSSAPRGTIDRQRKRHQ